MLKVGITGGIGTGKSIVCRVFETLGIPVFNADAAAKYLMENDKALREKLIAVFGAAVYEHAKLNRPLLAGIIFNDAQKLEAMNAIVHPATIQYGQEWMAAQADQAAYVLKEAAIMFESGSSKDMDYIIGVDAPLELRIQRVQKRDNSSAEKIMERIHKQMPQEEKMALCDFVIRNDEQHALIPQVLDIHAQLLQMSLSA